MVYANIGHVQPARMSSIDMRSRIRDMVEYHSEVDEDLELPLLEGEEWGDRGEKYTIHNVFNFSILFHFYFVMPRQVKKWFMKT